MLCLPIRWHLVTTSFITYFNSRSIIILIPTNHRLFKIFEIYSCIARFLIGQLLLGKLSNENVLIDVYLYLIKTYFSLNCGNFHFTFFEINHHFISTKEFSFIYTYLLLRNILLGIEQIALLNSKYSTKGSHVDMFLILTKYTRIVVMIILNTLLVS